MSNRPTAASPRTPVREVRTLAENRQARHQFFIEDTLEAGLILQGWEVKSILAGQANFNGGNAFIKFEGGEAFLDALTITPQPQFVKGLLTPLEPNRLRKLLLHRSELNKLLKRVAEKGYTVVPLALSLNGKVKLTIGLAKGKKLSDKRDVLKERDQLRDMQRELKAH